MKLHLRRRIPKHIHVTIYHGGELRTETDLIMTRPSDPRIAQSLLQLQGPDGVDWLLTFEER